MAVNKNFVVKNGIEVATDLIFASSDLDKVGIGSTTPTATLEVGGDAKVTGNSTVVGVATVQDDLVVGTGGTVITADVSAGRIGLNTATPEHNVHISNVGSSSTTLYVDGGHLKVDGDIYADNIGGLTDINAVNLNVTGIATFGDGSGVDSVDINADVDMDANLHLTGVSTFVGNTFVGSAVSIYASSGIVSATEFHGDGSNLSGVTATAGGSLGFSTTGAVGYGITFLKFVGAGVSTLSAPHSGIATLTIVGGGGGSASIGIGTTQGDAGFDSPVDGNLWYHTELGRLFIYYDDGSSSQWVDAAPFNIGIITASLGSLNQGTALAPPLAFSGDSSTGLFSPTSGQQTFVSVGSSILNVNPSGVEVTGVATATSFSGSGSGLTGVSTNFVSAIGIQSGGTVIGSGITTLNFVGTGNTFAVNGTTVDISIEGGGGAGLSTTGISTGFIFSNPNSIDSEQFLTNADHNYAMFGPVALNATVNVGVGNTFTIV